MDIVTLGAALNGSAEYVNSHFIGGSNIQIVDNPDGTQTINASGEVSSEDIVARAEIAEMKDGTTLDSFGDVETALTGKVDTESGKGLSENDFTDALKTKLDGIESGAEVNVQSDWGQTDNTADDYIKGKPTIPTAYTSTPAMDGIGSAGSSTSWAKGDHVHPSDTTKVDKVEGKGLSTNDYTDVEKTKLAGIAEGAEVNVQSDWNQTTDTADDYIKNKPTLGTAAAKNATDTYNATGDDVTTGKAVAAALATLPEPMIFKGSLGTGGTITTLPAASSSNKGYVYKVITAGTYASQSAKVGDTFISDGSAWVLIPSGDEPSGTVTNVAVANGGGLTVSGSPITTSGTITVGHSNSVTAKTSSSLKKFTYDANGHVTGSSELSTAESDALASGIDSTKVEQIETNKNNISSLTQYGGGINKFQVTATSTTINGITFTVNADKTITATGSIADSSKNAIFTIGTYTAVSGDVLSEGFTEARLNAYIYARGGSTTLATTPYRAIEAGDIGVQRAYACAILANTVGQVNITFKPMICNSDIYAKSSVYQPYALPNTAITPALQECVENSKANYINFPDKTMSAAGYVYDWTAFDIPQGNYVISLKSNVAGVAVAIELADTYATPYNQKGYRIINPLVVGVNQAEMSVADGAHYVRLYANGAVGLSDIMLIPVQLYNAGITTYQPYAMSNAELTAAIQAIQAQLANQ